MQNIDIPLPHFLHISLQQGPTLTFFLENMIPPASPVVLTWLCPCIGARSFTSPTRTPRQQYIETVQLYII